MLLSAMKETHPALGEPALAILEDAKLRGCIQCGTCGGVCPFGFLMAYPPLRIISAVRSGSLQRAFANDDIWMCISCSACTTACPAQLPLTLNLMTRAKEEQLLNGNLPSELQSALENSQRYGNPLGESPRKRIDWMRRYRTPGADHGQRQKASRYPVVRWRLCFLSSQGPAGHPDHGPHAKPPKGRFCNFRPGGKQ